MKSTEITYAHSGKRVPFEQIKDKECFYSNGTLYMKILSQDINWFHITGVNSVSIVNADLTLFYPNESVELAIRKIKEKDADK